MGKIEFNGKSTEDLELIVQTAPTYTFPERDMSSVHVPGRNGDLYIDNGSFKNVDRTYSLAKVFRRNEQHYPTNAEQILAWLHSAKGKYAILKDSYDSNVYRKAMFHGSGQFTNILDQALTFTVTFKCKPQRYLISGDDPVDIELTTYTEEGEYMAKKTGEIENTYFYTTLPAITISGIDSALVNLDEILMLTIENDEKVKASVTISKLGVEQGATLGSLTIDSDNVSVKDANGKDRNVCVGLNGKGFPTLEGGINNISLDKFTIEEYSPTKQEAGKNLPTYTNIINNYLNEHNGIVQVKYMSKSDLEVEQQDKITIKSWDMLIASRQSKYPAKSVQAYVEDVSEKYEFISFNSILDNVGQEYSFVGVFDEIAAVVGGTVNDKLPTDWLRLHKNDNNVVEMYARIPGFYMFKDEDKKIKYYTSGDKIGNAKPNNTNNVRFYPANGHELAIGFENVPDWLEYDIVHETSGTYSPIQIDFKLIKPGYIWKDKSGLFGKASWKRYDVNSDDSFTPVLLDSIIWDSGKKAFVSKKGILPSTNTTTKYMYVSELPQYTDIFATSIDDDGEETVSVTASPTFIIEDLSSDLSSIKLKAKNAGYFKISAPSKEGEWMQDRKNVDADLKTLKGTEAFDVYYLSDIPNYRGVYIDEKTGNDLWPAWLNPEPVFNPNANKLQPTAIGFEVLQNSNYRHTSINDTEQLSRWEHQNSGDVISLTNDGDRKASKTPLTICKLDVLPKQLPFDRQYLDGNGDPFTDLPDWFTVEYYYSKDLEESTKLENDAAYRDYIAQHPKKEIYVRFKTNISSPTQSSAFYKWDNNTAWIRKSSGEDMFRSGIKDNSVLYCINSDTLPQYGEYDLFTVTPVPDSSGNPSAVKITLKVDGYFRANNNSDWTKYKADDEIINSKIGEMNTIRYLKPITGLDNDPLANVAITIIPRWWML